MFQSANAAGTEAESRAGLPQFYRTLMSMTPSNDSTEEVEMTHYCSFCGKSEHELECLVTSENRLAFICPECTNLTTDIIAKNRELKAQAEATPPTAQDA